MPGQPPDAPALSDRVLHILSEAARLFAAEGYERTSMRDIAEACGISKSLLYHHFTDKDELYARIALGFTRELHDFVAARLAGQPGTTGRVRLFMLASAEYFDRYRVVWTASTAAFWSDPQLRRQEERMAWRDRYEHLLRDLLTAAVAAGEMRHVDVAMAGRLILSTLNWMHRWHRAEKGLSAVQVAGMYYDMIFAGLRAPVAVTGDPPRTASPPAPARRAR